MISVPSVIKNLFNTDGIRKNIRVSFPNGEHRDLTNADIEFESVSLTESLSSQLVIKFGLCESPCLEFTCHGIPNIKGKTIKVAIEIDVSSLTAEEIAEYGEISADVAFPFYSVPYGIYKVKQCVRSGDTDKRKITAYSKLAYMDWNQFPENLEYLKYQTWKNSMNITFGMQDMMYFYLPKLLEDNLVDIETKYDNRDRGTRSSVLVMLRGQGTGESTFDTYNPQGTYWDIVNGSLIIPAGVSDYTYVEILYKELSVSRGAEMSLNSYETVQILYKAITSESGYNDALDELNTYLKSQGYIEGDGKLVLRECSTNELYRGGINPDGIPFAPYSRGLSGTTAVPIWNDPNTPRFSLLPLYDDGDLYSFVRVNTYDYKYVENVGACYDTNADVEYTLNNGAYRGLDDKTGAYVVQQKTWHFIPSIILIPRGFRVYRYEGGTLVEDHTINITGNKLYGYRRIITGTGALSINSASEVIKVKTLSNNTYINRTDQSLFNSINSLIGQKVDYRDLIQSILEIQGKFGMIDRITGDLKIVDLTDHLMLYPSEEIYPAQDLYPRGTDAAVYRSEYRSVEYDEAPTKHYDRIECTWTDSNNVEHYQYYDIVDHDAVDYDPDDYQTYSLTDNYFIKNKFYTTSEIDDILETLGEKIKDFQYYPCNIAMRGLPYLETGDGISVVTRDSGFNTYVLRRVLKGINILEDNIEAQ